MIEAYIIVYDFFRGLPQLVSDIKRLGATPIIVDNASTYPPLLKWYEENKNNIEINRLQTNLGPFGAVKTIILPRATKGNSNFIVTDCDLDISSVPDDAIAVLEYGLKKYPDVWKVGFSLEIDDLPERGVINGIVKNQQKEFWKVRRDETFFSAKIATTFALWSRSRPIRSWYGPALRTDKPYCARHIPWYYTKENIDDNLKYLIKVSSKKYVGGNNFPKMFRMLKNL